ncbi:MAG: TRZ/ATZ family hydrolase [Gammaproteobacteria bacterium]|jgi:5-methylthioadenosine/S-adenosylhomocysteine deaminase|nr:TRZ/ATZ family hydrolase [Gammaproteobacteria bacterium]
MQQIDTLVHARWVVPVEPHGRVLAHHAVAVHNGRIVAVEPSPRARSAFRAAHEVDLPAHALIPGLVNAHGHAAMTLFRGLADDLPLMTWLGEHIWPAEARWVSEEFVAAGTGLALAEMLRGGTTCFNDMYFFPQVTARAAAAAGMRAVVGLIVLDFPSAWAADADAYFARAVDVFDELKGHPLVRTAFAPHAPYSVSDAPLARVRKLADELELPVHIHVHETRDEIAQSLERHGVRPIARLDRLGLVSPSLVAVHMTQLEDEEIALFAAKGAHVVHCPESNLKLASGFCPVQRLLDAGVDVALGTDGAASNNDLDMFGELRTAALLAKGVAADPSAVPAATALRMATLNGARALGLADEVGSLVPGKEADLVAVDLSFPETQPVHHPISQLVYAAGRRQVSHVWIAGRPVLVEGRLTTIDLDKAREDAEAWRARIAAG